MSSRFDNESDGQVLTRRTTKKKLKRPRLYKVLFHNDDYTPREFVILLLEHVFHMDESSATQIMLFIHKHGVGVVGIYPFAIAETKVAEVMGAAEHAGFPLMCSMEPEQDEEDADDAAG